MICEASLKNVHCSGVRGIEYHPGTDTLTSCSGHSRTALVVTRPHLAARRYIFNIHKVFLILTF